MILQNSSCKDLRSHQPPPPPCGTAFVHVAIKRAHSIQLGNFRVRGGIIKNLKQYIEWNDATSEILTMMEKSTSPGWRNSCLVKILLVGVEQRRTRCNFLGLDDVAAVPFFDFMAFVVICWPHCTWRYRKGRIQ